MWSKFIVKQFNKLGFKNYNEYLKSDHWQNLKQIYKESLLPQYCIICHNEKFNLHHRSYERIGNEMIFDLIPLCQSCHFKVHKYCNENNTTIQTTHHAIRKVFKLKKKEVQKIFEPFSLNKNFKWMPLSLEDLELIKQKIGETTFLKLNYQNRIFNKRFNSLHNCEVQYE